MIITLILEFQHKFNRHTHQHNQSPHLRRIKHNPPNPTPIRIISAMTNLSYQTAGESHGKTVLAIIRGLPAGLTLDENLINTELKRRQGGYGRGGRQNIETDTVEFLTGTRNNKTIASPLTLQIINRDARIDDPEKTPPVHRPRPGHADLAGSIKWLTTDCRETLERASARETAARAAAGAVAKCLLNEFNITVIGYVRSIQNITLDQSAIDNQSPNEIITNRNASVVYCPDAPTSEKMKDAIHDATVAKDTVGGIVETQVHNCPIGLGSCMNWDEKLDARIAAAVMGIQAFKGVEIGLGFEATQRTGSKVHDPIHYDESQKQTSPALGFTRSSNNAGGLEGGMTNGMPVVVRGAMKPISTILQGLPSVDLNTKESQTSSYERSDICAVSAASVVMENVIAFEIARALLEKFAGDSLHETKTNYTNYQSTARQLPLDKTNSE